MPELSYRIRLYLKPSSGVINSLRPTIIKSLNLPHILSNGLRGLAADCPIHHRFYHWDRSLPEFPHLSFPIMRWSVMSLRSFPQFGRVAIVSNHLKIVMRAIFKINFYIDYVVIFIQYSMLKYWTSRHYTVFLPKHCLQLRKQPHVRDKYLSHRRRSRHCTVSCLRRSCERYHQHA